MSPEEREHIPSMDCWCGPVTLAYGDQVVYDDAGNVLEINRESEVLGREGK